MNKELIDLQRSVPWDILFTIQRRQKSSITTSLGYDFYIIDSFWRKSMHTIHVYGRKYNRKTKLLSDKSLECRVHPQSISNRKEQFQWGLSLPCTFGIEDIYKYISQFISRKSLIEIYLLTLRPIMCVQFWASRVDLILLTSYFTDFRL